MDPGNYDDNATAIKAHQVFLRNRRAGATSARTRTTSDINYGLDAGMGGYNSNPSLKVDAAKTSGLGTAVRSGIQNVMNPGNQPGTGVKTKKRHSLNQNANKQLQKLEDEGY